MWENAMAYGRGQLITFAIGGTGVALVTASALRYFWNKNQSKGKVEPPENEVKLVDPQNAIVFSTAATESGPILSTDVDSKEVFIAENNLDIGSEKELLSAGFELNREENELRTATDEPPERPEELESLVLIQKEKREFHDQGDAKWMVIRGQLWGHNDKPFRRRTPGRPIGRPGVSYSQGVFGLSITDP
jgi:hypothetical protein